MERWKEYDAGTLMPPCVVQHDQVGTEHLIWVWDGERIQGPFSRTSDDEAGCIAAAVEARDNPTRPEEPIPDPVVAAQLAVVVAERDALAVENAALETDKAALVKQRDEALQKLAVVLTPIDTERIR